MGIYIFGGSLAELQGQNKHQIVSKFTYEDLHLSIYNEQTLIFYSNKFKTQKNNNFDCEILLSVAWKMQISVCKKLGTDQNTNGKRKMD